MATRTKAPIAPEPDPDQYSDIIDRDTLAPALAAIKAELGIDDVDASVFVYKIDADGQGNDYRVWTSDDPDTYNLDMIARKFGSGRYRVRVYMKDADGNKTIRINKVQPIMLSPEDQQKYDDSKNPAKTSANNASGDMKEIVAQMMAGFQSTIAQVLTAQKSAPVVDPFSQMEKLAAMMKTLAPAQPVAPGPDLLSLLGMLEKLKNITGGNAPADASATEMLLMKAADAFLPAVAQGLQQNKAPQAATPQYVEPAMTPLPAPTLDDEAEQMKLLEQMKLKMFSLQLIAANKAQARGVAPDVYAETIYDNFDEADIQAVATNPEWFAIMCQAVPDCAGREAWYRSVRDKLITMAIEDELLYRAPDGGLTTEPESGTNAESESTSAPNGPVIA